MGDSGDPNARRGAVGRPASEPARAVRARWEGDGVLAADGRPPFEPRPKRLQRVFDVDCRRPPSHPPMRLVQM